MRQAMVDAGLVRAAPPAGGGNSRRAGGDAAGGSPHPLHLVLEPEAASIYCQARARVLLRFCATSKACVAARRPFSWWCVAIFAERSTHDSPSVAQCKLGPELLRGLESGGNVMVVDCGGGTVDTVVHRREARPDGGGVGLREVARGAGDCCGGTLLDAEFVAHLRAAMPTVFDAYAAAQPREVLRGLLGKWELQKRSFDGSDGVVIDLPPKLARAWHAHKAAHYEQYGAEARRVRRAHDCVCVLLARLV